jgi:hypothetical protein
MGVRSLGLCATLLAVSGACGCALDASPQASPGRVTPPSIAELGDQGSIRPVARGPLAVLPEGPLSDAMADEWTWLDVPGSTCANGTPTGVAVNVHPGATRLVFFLEGGGACDTAEDCWVHPTAINIASGYGVGQLEQDPQLGLPIFARGDAANPFADASYVFVPYCTGDLHAGSATVEYVVDRRSWRTYHYGAKNLDLDLQMLGGAFPGIQHVWLVGQSAGGFGTLFNQSFVEAAFGVATDVIDDSGPGIGTSGYPQSWNVRLPPGCGDCADGLQSLFLFDRATYPDSRFAFLSFQVDSVLPGFYGVSQQDVSDWLGQYEQTLTDLPNSRSFVAPGTGHVVIGDGIDDVTRTQMLGWLAQMADGSPLWENFAPAPDAPIAVVR